MNHTRRVFVCLLGLVVILSILVFPVSAQGNDTSLEKDYLLQSQRNLDRSLSVLNTVATLMGVLVGILALVIAIVGGLGIFEIKKWHKTTTDIENYAKSVSELKTKLEKCLDEARNKVEGISQTVSPEKPSDEVLRKLDEFSRQFVTLELLGAKLKPEDYNNRGNDLFYKKDYESALKAYDKAIELKPDNDIALSNKGTVLGKLGRYNEAIEIYDNAIELKPDFAISWFERARIYSLMGNKQNAISDLEKAIELYPILKTSAKIDEDFKTLWDDEDFKKLVE